MCFPVKEAKAVLTSENHNELGLLAEAQSSGILVHRQAGHGASFGLGNSIFEATLPVR